LRRAALYYGAMNGNGICEWLATSWACAVMVLTLLKSAVYQSWRDGESYMKDTLVTALTPLLSYLRY